MSPFDIRQTISGGFGPHDHLYHFYAMISPADLFACRQADTCATLQEINLSGSICCGASNSPCHCLTPLGSWSLRPYPSLTSQASSVPRSLSIARRENGCALANRTGMNSNVSSFLKPGLLRLVERSPELSLDWISSSTAGLWLRCTAQWRYGIYCLI